MKKQIAIGGYGTFIIKTKVGFIHKKKGSLYASILYNSCFWIFNRWRMYPPQSSHLSTSVPQTASTCSWPHQVSYCWRNISSIPVIGYSRSVPETTVTQFSLSTAIWTSVQRYFNYIITVYLDPWMSFTEKHIWFLVCVSRWRFVLLAPDLTPLT